jgi:two-component system, NtrC family, sensor kinase
LADQSTLSSGTGKEKAKKSKTLKEQIDEKDRQIQELKHQLSQTVEQKSDSVRELKFIKERILNIEKMAGLGKMFVSMANELNNLLSGIMGFAQLMQTSPECPGSMRHDLEMLYSQAQRTHIIIRGLLAFSHLQKIEREPVNIREILDYVVGLKEHYMSFDNIELVVDVPEDPPEIMGNPDSLQHLFINLMNNAHQALKNHKGARKLILRTQYQKGFIQIIFEDTGPGVIPEYKERLFEPFFSTWGEKESLGLGLATSYGIVSEHGGNLYYKDRPTGGAIFIVELPLRRDMARETGKSISLPRENGKLKIFQARPPQSSAPSDQVERRRRILLVDDEEPILSMLSDSLSQEGFDVVSTIDGQKALELLDIEDFDMIITDVKMPGISGIHIYWFIEKKKPQIIDKIVFITGDIIDSTTRSFLKSIDNPYFTKPFDVKKFTSIIKNIL